MLRFLFSVCIFAGGVKAERTIGCFTKEGRNPWPSDKCNKQETWKDCESISNNYDCYWVHPPSGPPTYNPNVAMCQTTENYRHPVKHKYEFDTCHSKKTRTECEGVWGDKCQWQDGIETGVPTQEPTVYVEPDGSGCAAKAGVTFGGDRCPGLKSWDECESSTNKYYCEWTHGPNGPPTYKTHEGHCRVEDSKNHPADYAFKLCHGKLTEDDCMASKWSGCYWYTPGDTPSPSKAPTECPPRPAGCSASCDYLDSSWYVQSCPTKMTSSDCGFGCVWTEDDEDYSNQDWEMTDSPSEEPTEEPTEEPSGRPSESPEEDWSEPAGKCVVEEKYQGVSWMEDGCKVDAEEKCTAFGCVWVTGEMWSTEPEVSMAPAEVPVQAPIKAPSTADCPPRPGGCSVSCDYIGSSWLDGQCDSPSRSGCGFGCVWNDPPTPAPTKPTPAPFKYEPYMTDLVCQALSDCTDDADGPFKEIMTKLDGLAMAALMLNDGKTTDDSDDSDDSGNVDMTDMIGEIKDSVADLRATDKKMRSRLETLESVVIKLLGASKKKDIRKLAKHFERDSESEEDSCASYNAEYNPTKSDHVAFSEAKDLCFENGCYWFGEDKQCEESPYSAKDQCASKSFKRNFKKNCEKQYDADGFQCVWNNYMAFGGKSGECRTHKCEVLMTKKDCNANKFKVGEDRNEVRACMWDDESCVEYSM